jgi:Arc/MetJ family transcription regulator
MLRAVAKRCQRNTQAVERSIERCYIPCKELETMKATIAIDDELFAAAQEYAGDKEKSAVINEALKAYVQVEAGRRRARMGGSEPNAKAPPRRRPPY